MSTRCQQCCFEVSTLLALRVCACEVSLSLSLSVSFLLITRCIFRCEHVVFVVIVGVLLTDFVRFLLETNLYLIFWYLNHLFAFKLNLLIAIIFLLIF